MSAATLAEWHSLSEEPERPNPFFAPWFLRPAMKWLDPEKAVHLLLIHDDETGELVGLIPVVTGATYARLPLKHVSVWKNDHLYNGTPLIRLGYARQAMAALVGWIGTCPMGIRFLRFTQLAADGPVYHALTAACAHQDREMFLQSRQSRAVLRSGHKFDALLEAAQSSKQRSELRRRIKRFADTGTVELTERKVTPCTADALSEAFLSLENTGWKSNNDEGFALAKTANSRAFFLEVMRNAAEAGKSSATVLTRDSSPVAIGYSLRDQDMMFGFKTAFDRSHAKASIGIRIFHETTRRMLQTREISLYDSCAMPGHPVLDKLWPDRLDYVQVNVPARGVQNTHLVRFAAQVESVKDKLQSLRG